MADPATNTAYPNSLEVLPAIGSGTLEDDPGCEHDKVHDRAHATLNAIQQLLGTTGDADPESLLARVSALTLGGILVQCGSKDGEAEAIPVGTEISGISPSGYRITGWRLWCYPAASIVVDVRRDAFSNVPPSADDSMTGASPPATAGAISAAATLAPGEWDDQVQRGDALTAAVTANNGATWFALLLMGNRQ